MKWIVTLPVNGCGTAERTATVVSDCTNAKHVARRAQPAGHVDRDRVRGRGKRHGTGALERRDADDVERRTVACDENRRADRHRVPDRLHADAIWWAADTAHTDPTNPVVRGAALAKDTGVDRGWAALTASLTDDAISDGAWPRTPMPSGPDEPMRPGPPSSLMPLKLPTFGLAAIRVVPVFLRCCPHR